MTSSLLGLGANLGDRERTLRAAVAALGRFLNITAVSPIYETPPMYDTDQAPFFNMAVTVDTDLSPQMLLGSVKALERRLGRVPGRRNGPRAIDIDIILFGQQEVDIDDLSIPHPGLAERGFVLVPAADIAADWQHPGTGLSVAAMLSALGPQLDIIRIDDVAERALAACG